MIKYLLLNPHTYDLLATYYLLPMGEYLLKYTKKFVVKRKKTRICDKYIKK